MEEGSWDEEDVAKYAFTRVVPLLAGILCFCIGAKELADSVKYIVNPEYYAVRDILILLVNPTQAAK